MRCQAMPVPIRGAACAEQVDHAAGYAGGHGRAALRRLPQALQHANRGSLLQQVSASPAHSASKMRRSSSYTVSMTRDSVG